MILDLDIDAFIAEHVTGRIQSLDVANMKQEPSVVVYEVFRGHQLRTATYLHHLALTPKLMRPHCTGTGLDTHEYSPRWFAFFDHNKSNVRCPDHPDQGGDVVKMMRVYTPPSNGRPGRLTCTNSLQDIYRPFRNRLLEGVCSDVDQVCAAATYALWVAETANLKHTQLANFVRDSKQLLADFARCTGLTPHAAKKRLVQIWACAPQQKFRGSPDFPEFQHLCEEVQQLKKQAFHDSRWKWVHPYIKSDNPYGSFFSHVLTALESAVTNECIRFAQSKFKWEVQAIVHDGFNPVGLFNNDKDGDYLRAMEAVARALLPGLKLKWTFKPFDYSFYSKKDGALLSTFSVPADWVIPVTAAPDESETTHDPDEDFEGDAEYAPSYHLVKKAFEPECFRVDTSFVDLSVNKGAANLSPFVINPKSDLLISHESKKYSQSELVMVDHRVKRDAFGRPIKQRKDVSFIKRWLKDKDQKSFKRLVMEPDGTADTEAFNMWSGYRAQTIGEYDRVEGRRIVEKVLNHCYHLFMPVEADAQFDFFMKWLAHPFLYPGSKPGIMACLLGPQGGGKTTALSILEKLMGQNLEYVTTSPELSVFGTNGTFAIADKKFINIQEVPSSSVGPYLNKLRPLITDPRIEVKSMRENPINITSAHVFAISSNFEDAIDCDTKEERRFWTVYCATYWKHAFSSVSALKEHFDTLTQEMNTKAFIGEMYNFLLHMPGVQKSLQNDVPTSALQQTSRESKPLWYIEFFHWLVEASDFHIEGKALWALDGKVRLKNSDLREQLECFATMKNWNFCSLRGLTDKMRYMNCKHEGLCIEIVSSYKRKAFRAWDIDLPILFKAIDYDVQDFRDQVNKADEREQMEARLAELKKHPLPNNEELYRLKAQLEGESSAPPPAPLAEFDPSAYYEKIMGADAARRKRVAEDADEHECKRARP